jgi:hypothetical protein
MSLKPKSQVLSLTPMDMEQLTEEPEWVFPYAYMQPGDSFFIPTLRPAQMIYAADTAAKKAEIRVKIYTCHKDGHLGIRVWRMA